MTAHTFDAVGGVLIWQDQLAIKAKVQGNTIIVKGKLYMAENFLLDKEGNFQASVIQPEIEYAIDTSEEFPVPDMLDELSCFFTEWGWTLTTVP